MYGKCTILLTSIVLCGGPTFGQPANREQVASVAGQPIFASELDQALQSSLWQLRTQEYELRNRALETLIDRKLLEMEAAKRGIPAEKLLRDEIDAKIAEPGDAEVEAYYLGQKTPRGRPFEEVRAQLRQALQQAKIERARETYFHKLRAGAEVAVLLRPPRIEVDPKRLRGNPDAPVTIVEFADFQCPFCRLVQPTLEQVLQKYRDKVNLSFRDLPLDQIHTNASKAAEAAHCAADQGKFWKYQEALFRSADLSETGLSAQARAVGLDGPAFDACLSSGKFKSQVEEDQRMGLQAGVSGTPGFIINGVALQGSQPLQAFEKIIDAQLAKLAPQPIASGKVQRPEPAR